MQTICRFIAVPLLAISAGILSHAASAVPLVVMNPGFEDTSGHTVVNEFTLGTPTDWNIYDPMGITGNPDLFLGTLEPNGTDFFNATAPEGVKVAILFNRVGVPTEEYGLVQSLTDTLMANTRYELRVQVGNIASGTDENLNFYNLDGFSGYRVELLAGGVVVAQDNNSLTIPEGEFAESVVTLDVGAGHAQLGQLLGIRLVHINEVPAGMEDVTDLDREVDFDDVRLDATAIPAPGGLALMLVAVLGVAMRRRLV